MFLLFLTNSFSSCLVPSPFCPSLHHFSTRYTSFFSFSGPSFSFPIHLSLGWLFLLPHRIPGPPSLTRFLPSLPPSLPSSHSCFPPSFILILLPHFFNSCRPLLLHQPLLWFFFLFLFLFSHLFHPSSHFSILPLITFSDYTNRLLCS